MAMSFVKGSTYKPGKDQDRHRREIDEDLAKLFTAISPAAGSGGVTPGGDDTNVQFNDAGAFGGNSGFVYDETSFHIALSAGTLNQSTTGWRSITFENEVINVRETFTDQTESSCGIMSFLTANLASNNSSYSLAGMLSSVQTNAGNTKNLSQICGIKTQAVHLSTGVLADAAIGIWAQGFIDASSSGGTPVAGFFRLVNNKLGTSGIGVYIEDGNRSLGSNNYGSLKKGLLIEAMQDSDSSAAVGDDIYNIYSDATYGRDSIYRESINLFMGPVMLTNYESTQPNGNLTIRNSMHILATGTISSAGTTVSGSGTKFLSEVEVGTNNNPGVVIKSNSGQYRFVTSVASNTSLVTDTAFSPALSSSSFTVIRPVIHVFEDEFSTVTSPTFMLNRGRVGIGTNFPSTALEVNGTITATSISSGLSLTDSASNIVFNEDEIISNDDDFVVIITD